VSDEHDSWLKNAFGVDLGKAVDTITDEVSAAASSVSQVVDKARVALKEVPAAGGSGSFPLGGSVGRGGTNAAGDVRVVQAALGLSADGDCGPQTIAAIEAYQRKLGHSKPDGRVDVGGATERALAAARAASAAAEPRSPSSGRATGKRSHKPFSFGPVYDGGSAPSDDLRTLGERAIDGMRDMLGDTDLARHLASATADDRSTGD
jgi:peptidoglycan hydrolase-like protein with peptidoglycan-binding domain